MATRTVQPSIHDTICDRCGRTKRESEFSRWALMIIQTGGGQEAPRDLCPRCLATLYALLSLPDVVVSLAGPAADLAALAGEEEEPEPEPEWDPGPEVDDQGGMSEVYPVHPDHPYS